MDRRAGLFWVVTIVLLVAGSSGQPAWAQLPPDAQLRGAEEHTIAILPPPAPHRVYVLDLVFPHLVAAKVYIVDGDKQQVLGMLNAGYTPNMVVPPGHGELYLAETYWSRGTRGTRTDVVTFYDPRTLLPGGEVVLPNGRFLVVTKKQGADVTPDGRYLLSFNMAPRTTVSLVDVKARRYLGEIETPGCALVFPSAPRRFSSVCTDGALLTATFDESGKATARRSRPFFDPKTDPVFEHAGFSKSRGRIYFVSYEGMVHPVDVSGADPVFETPWSLLADAEKQEQWRPGGWQVAALHRDTNRLLVLMHKGPRWTHKQAGEEIWVFEVGSRRRVGRFPLEHHGISVAVSQDARPQAYTLSEKQSLSLFDLDSGKALGIMEGLGEFGMVMYVDGE
jgi:methylamine dehydrogenase heavy chain